MNTLLRSIILILVAGVVGIIAFYFGLSILEAKGNGAKGFSEDPSCTVAVIPLSGTVIAYEDSIEDDPNASSGDALVSSVEAAEADPGIKAIVLRIDSGGGSMTAAESIMNALKWSPLPSVAFIRSQGASAAYMAATGADRLIASRYAEVGSIGITYSYLEYATQNQDSGVDYLELSSGPYKDMGSPDRFLTAEEEALFRRNIDIFYEAFVQQVAESRHLPVEKVREFADGSVMPAELALTAGLIDEIGAEDAVRAYIAGQTGIAADRLVFCERSK